MKVFHGRADGGHSEQRGETFTGTVYADPVMPATSGVTINTVFFAPQGRTYWHTHELGQVLQVTAGKGWICVEGEAPQEIRQGDIVFIGPNERHWHGASDASYMVHIATSLGKATWQEEVAEADYPKGLTLR
ncbi:cupin domain-containing protein [Paraburkholderia caballeronis]|uniref:Cupin domain protein n=1 Tax=Paraburkholderia caballeronis TaxID=416943 RepID=A0A1H7F198_9BURK|nr:cupin domain-containing protein [Paraburkholderia caballeronis]PXW23918.1 quercetin dioxygenase-like cupin family protein [Paraburkholderia caballeronis]PXW99682.1 quercetin dioxygenase-like cupin family protein [Paraburkholderia caballeronis]RAJ96636.1 quercetin dioxygenase-like cupin family protein [Paraburkholderia caballeronis]TDV15624.1 quercetin dioxygenase-like cupin family protein [Paraburkholderia caballeronis]TDV17879.1 quercetin dioxygenase-like cupin family protein [Paraburkhold